MRRNNKQKPLKYRSTGIGEGDGVDAHFWLFHNQVLGAGSIHYFMVLNDGTESLVDGGKLAEKPGACSKKIPEHLGHSCPKG